MGAAGSRDTAPDAGAQNPLTVATEHLRGSSLLLAGKVFAFGLGFASQVLMVRYLSKGEFGAFAFALSAVTLLQAFAGLEMANVVARFLPIYRERREHGKLFGAMLLAFCVVAAGGVLSSGAVVAAIALLGLRPIADDQAIQLLALLALLIPFQAIDNLFTSLFAAFGSAKAIVLRQSVLIPSLRFLLVLGMIAAGADVTFLALGYLAVALLGVVLSAVLFLRLLRRNGLADEWRSSRISWPAGELFGFALPLLGTTLVWALMDASAGLFLGYFHGTAAVAEFRAVLPLAQINLLVSATFGTLYMPIAARLHARSDRAGLNDLYWQAALWMAVLSFPAYLIGCGFAGPVTTLIYGAEYAASAPLLAMLSFAYFVHTASGFNGLTVKVIGKLRYIVAIDLTTAAVSLVLNLLLISRWGALGAAIGMTATMLLHNLLKHFGAWKHAGISPLPPGQVSLFVLLLVLPPVLALHALIPGGIWVAVPLGVGAVVLTIWMGWDGLRLLATFPELRRLPLIGALVRRRAPPG